MGSVSLYLASVSCWLLILATTSFLSSISGNCICSSVIEPCLLNSPLPLLSSRLFSSMVNILIPLSSSSMKLSSVFFLQRQSLRLHLGLLVYLLPVD